MSTPSPLKIPPSVANAERKDLEKLLVTTLHKMKAKDRQIAELEAERDGKKPEAISSPTVGNEEAGKRVEELENVVGQLENRILESEEKFERRMKAERDLLEQNVAEARKESEEYRTRLGKEMQKVAEMEMKYSAMGETVDGMKREKDGLVEEIGKAEEEKAGVDEFLSAEKQAWLSEKRDLEKEVEDMKKKMAELEEARSEMEGQLKTEVSKSLQGEILTLKSALDEARRELEEQPKADNVKSMEFIESAYVPKEEFLKLQDELSEAKRKHAGSIKKRQSEFDQK